ncbi:uncharacterized protein LOC134816452 [Bolinopsis microptera]|uniref:uncharacterized protein LOC134816452 n=1 Tax=Bolinopsis microptera TaxID=2820187 RepID=UPI0030795E81
MGEGTRDGGTGKKTLTLLSPVGGPPLTYTWPLQQLVRGKCAVDEAHELLDTIRWVIKEHPVLREGPIENSTKNIVISDYDCMKQLCDMYNSETKKISCQTNSTNREPASKALLRVILHRTYAHAVFDPEKLNSYQPFSPEVYGETSFEMIDQLMDDVPFKTGATFLDLGSGVGQVVLQVAASNICRICYGIEQAATPCYYAKAMATHFIRWMNFFGKPFSEFKMMEGDFLDDKYRAILQDSNTIFVNNFAFGPSLNHKLKERFAKFAEGVKIISSSEFRPINFRITTRNITDVGTILRVREVHPRVPGSVSWTNNDVCYFIHTVDRSYLEEYMRLQRAKYGDKLESLMINADRKIKERCEDYKALPALSLESDHRTHLLSNLTEIEVPKVSSIGDLHELLNSHLSEYMSQCSSSYGEAALQLELEQSRVLKERLEEQLDHLDRNVHTEEEQVVTALDNRLAELGIKSRDPQGIGKELLYQVTGFKILHKRLDRLSSEVTNYQTAIKSSLLREVSTWRDNHERYTEYSTEVGIKQRVYQDVVSQLPGYDFKSLASVCQETAKGYKDRTKSLSKILLSIESLEKDNLQLEKELAVKREKLAAKKRVEEMASAAAAAEAARLLPTLPPKPAIKPELVAAKAVTIPLPMSVPEPVPVAATVKPREPSQPKPQLIGPPKLPLTAHPTSHATSHPVKIPTELTKPRPKPSVVIEQPITDVLVRPDMKDSAGMSHLDAILARNGLGHYIGNDYNTKRPEEYLLAQGHEQYRRRERSETKSGENTPSRPSSTTSNISHRSILQQQHKQINNINSLLIQQQTMAQREQKMAVGNDLGGTLAALRNPDMIPRNEQALLNEQMMHIETPARGELKQTEEKVLSSGTVPAKYPGSNPGSGYKEKTSMLKTTSPRLQLTTQTSNAKTTVLVPHYMLGNNKDSTTAETMMAVKPSNASTPGSASSSAIKSTPIPKSGSTGSSLPSTASSQLSATISQLGSSSSSYFSAYGSTADPLAQKPGDQNYPGPPPPAKPTSTEPPKAQIPKPKHKYPFQYLNQVYITGYAIMIHTLKAQYPNLRPELFNDLLSRSNFNPYTYFEYLKKLDNFEMTLESFYEMRPDLGEKCKTRAQRLAEKQAAQKLPEKGTTPQSATPTVPVPSTSLPITSSANNAPPVPPPRPAKEPQISIPRNNSNTTIIESYISSKGPPAPINSGPQPPPPGLITTELRLTKPSRDLKSPPHQFPFKSPNSSIHYPGESPNKTSPAKRPECSLQYHHLSLESFKNEPKNKVRRRTQVRMSNRGIPVNLKR